MKRFQANFGQLVIAKTNAPLEIREPENCDPVCKAFSALAVWNVLNVQNDKRQIL
ncbi:hypothetical protein D9M68_953900 [compost metagenome]